MAEQTVSDVRAWRKAERARLLELRRRMPASAHRDASDVIMHELHSRLPPQSHALVGCYWPFRREFNCLPYMREVLRSGGRVALPVVIGRGHPLQFRCWTEAAEMESGVWNIRHPASGEPVFPSALVIPLVGFDDAGYRLGYGAGYYDTTIASLAARPYLVAVGFEYSRLPTIYPQPHDQPMDVVITEAQTRDTFHRKSGWRGSHPSPGGPSSG